MYRILLIDDNPIELRFVQSLLQSRSGWQVDTASNGKVALEYLEQREPDVVLTDLMMPEMDGLELLEQMQVRYPRVPVVIMTSRGSEEIAVEALKKGATGYLTKREMGSQVDRVLESVIVAASHRQTQSRLYSHIKVCDLTFSLPNEYSMIHAAIRFLQEASKQTGILEESDWTQLGVALEEALSNAMIHGNLEVSSSLRDGEDSAYEQLITERKHQYPYCGRMIHVTARLNGDGVTFVVRDEGPGFDRRSIPDPTDPGNLSRPHGRGLFMIHHLMDEVRHNAAGNEITLVKRRKERKEADRSSKDEWYDVSDREDPENLVVLS